MRISTTKVKQYGSTHKHVLMVEGKPVCIVRGSKSLNDCISYLMSGMPTLKDGRIMKLLDKVKEGAKYGTLCFFKTENDTKRGRNLMEAKGIQTGRNICELEIGSDT